MKRKPTHAQISAKGGKSGRGEAKARPSEQARAAAQARWTKRQPKSVPNVKVSQTNREDGAAQPEM